MPENQKEKKDGTAAEDQKERGYYYDDAHGYEKYEPEDEEPDGDAETRWQGETEAGGTATRRHGDANRKVPGR